MAYLVSWRSVEYIADEDGSIGDNQFSGFQAVGNLIISILL